MAMTAFYMGQSTRRVDPTPILDRVDKNGTKYWHSNACPKCGGTGYLPGYEFIDGARCWKCGATGRHPHGWKEYTPEYSAKLAEKRLARERQKNLAARADWLFEQGFNEYDTTFVVVGNTYDLREELKAAGAKFSGFLGAWHFTDKPADYICVELTTDECFTENQATAALEWRERDELEALIRERAPKDDAPVSEHVGEVGKRLTVEVTLVKSFSFESNYGYYPTTSYIHNFVDAAGNVFIWKTTNSVSETAGKIKLTGTVKEHGEYRDIKQTILTRCKIA